MGSKRARNVEFATAAAITGTAEVVFLPLDTLKILAQTNPDRCVYLCACVHVCVCLYKSIPLSVCNSTSILLTCLYVHTYTHTHTHSLRGRSFFQVVQQEGLLRLYRGAGWTMARNFPGSFCLFGGSALVKEKVFHLEQYSDATFMQEVVASTTVRACVCLGVCVFMYGRVLETNLFFPPLFSTSDEKTHTRTHTHTQGAVWSLTVSSPADVIKARVQRASLSLSAQGTHTHTTGMEILRDLLKKEGPWALFKGLNTKFLVVAPKLILSFTCYNQVMSLIDKRIKE